MASDDSKQSPLCETTSILLEMYTKYAEVCKTEMTVSGIGFKILQQMFTQQKCTHMFTKRYVQ